MKTKLIKLNEEDYIIVLIVDDSLDSQIKEGDMFINEHNQISVCVKVLEEFLKTNKSPIKKIIHSTKPLEDVIIHNKYEGKGWINVKPLYLSEIEELFDYNAAEIFKQGYGIPISNNAIIRREGFIEGFNAHKELVKAGFLSTKLYSNENHLEWIYNRLIEVHGENSNYDYMIEFKKIIQSLQPKTEWDVQFINGKLTLKQ